MNVVAKVGWWGGSLLLAVCTRQALFGVLPLALHWHRQQMAQVSQRIDRRFPQVDQLLTQVQQLQTRLEQPTPSIRQHTVPMIQSIHALQQRLHRLELQTAPQVDNVLAQLDQLQTQVNHLAQGIVLRQGVGVFIDGANLHASARKWGVTLDYATLVSRFLPKDAQDTLITVHFYSGVDPNNWQQRRLHRDLHQMGFQVHTKPVTHFANGGMKANMDGQMIVDMVKSSFAHVILLSGDGDFLPALETLHQQGVQITVAAFASDTHRPMQQKFPFRDLHKICTAGGKVIALPVKQHTSVG